MVVCLVLSSLLVVDAVHGEHVFSLSSGSSLLRGTSFAEAFMGAEGRTQVAAGSGSDMALQRLRARAGNALGLGAATLVIFVFMGIFAIMCIAFKLGQQDQEIDKLHDRTRGLYQDWMSKEAGESRDSEKKRALKEQLAEDQRRVQAEKDRLKAEQDVLRGQQAAIEADRRTLAAQKEKIKSLASKDKALIDRILQRNKVFVDLDKKLFKIVEPIGFKSIRVMPGTKHAPPAEFEDEAAAQEVLSDLAQILEVVPQPRLLIEGHTAGGSKAVSDIGFEIACERAEKVVKMLVSLGVPKHRLESKGKPGLLGDNKFDTKIITLSWD